MLRIRERAPTLSPFNVFIFGLTIESIKELGGALVVLVFLLIAMVLVFLLVAWSCVLFDHCDLGVSPNHHGFGVLINHCGSGVPFGYCGPSFVLVVVVLCYS
jgi:hypothetical protein